MEAFHEPQGAAGILPAEDSEQSPADEKSAAPCWRHRANCSRFMVPMHGPQSLQMHCYCRALTVWSSAIIARHNSAEGRKVSDTVALQWTGIVKRRRRLRGAGLRHVNCTRRLRSYSSRAI